METNESCNYGSKSMTLEEAKVLDGGLVVLSPVTRLVKFAVALAISAADNWDEYQEGYSDGYEDATSN